MSNIKFGVLTRQVGFLVKGTVVHHHLNNHFAISTTPRTLNENSPITNAENIYLSNDVLNSRNLEERSVIRVSPTRTPANIFCQIKEILLGNENESESESEAQLDVIELLIGNYFERTPEREVTHAFNMEEVPDDIELSHDLCFFSAGTRFKRLDKWDYRLVKDMSTLAVHNCENLRISSELFSRNGDAVKEMKGDLSALLDVDNLTLTQNLLIKKLKHLSVGDTLLMPLISNLECMYESSLYSSRSVVSEPYESLSTKRIKGFLGTL